MPVRVKPISKSLWGLFALLVVVILAASLHLYRIRGGSGTERAEAISPKETARLFFSSNSERLSSKTLDLRGSLPERTRGEIILGELKKEKSIPDKTKLLDLAFGEDSTLYVNLSKDFVDGGGRSGNEITMVYSLVNSLISGFKDTRRVQLLVDGRAFQTVNGTVYTYLPLQFNNDLVEE